MERVLWAVVAYSYEGKGEVSFDGYERLFEDRARALIYSANMNKMYENWCYNVEPINESVAHAGGIMNLLWREE